MLNQKLNTAKNYFLYFIIYSIFGWFMEEIISIIMLGSIVDRGFLFGCWCPIYGTGALICINLFSNFINQKEKINWLDINTYILFCNLVFVCTILELCSSYIMEYFFGGWMWDYSTYFLNYQGRIATLSSLYFGIGGLIIIYYIQPKLEEFSRRLNQKTINSLATVFIILFSLDFVYTFFMI